jgi:hypothetical protein
MLKIHGNAKSVRAAVAAPVLLLALVGCGGSSDATPASQATGTPAANGQRGGGFGGVDMTAIQACLTAAGISVPTPSGMPSGGPRPSGTFNGTPPADGVRPSRAAGQGGAGGGGGGGMFQSAEVQAALKACGITVPTGRGSRPSGTPTS